MRGDTNAVRRAGLWAGAVVALAGVADLLLRFWPGWAAAGGFEDDFFYYAEIARRVNAGQGWSFDGVHATNGFHPLWMLCVAGMWRVGGESWFLGLVTAATVVSLGGVGWLSLRCLRRLGVTDGAGVIAALVVFWSLLLERGGMETVLALPLLLWLVGMWLGEGPAGAGRYLRLGLVGSLCVLARLDSILLVGLLLGLSVVLEWDGWGRWLRRGVGFAVGMTPVWAYLGWNRVRFGSMLPVSAQAKELRLHHWPQGRALVSLLVPVSGAKWVIALPGLAGVGVILWLLRRGAAGLTVRQRVVMAALAVFPVALYGSLCVVSDWPIWFWYFYPLVLAGMGGCVAVARLRPLTDRQWQVMAVGVVVVCLGYVLGYQTMHPPRRNAIFLAAEDVRGFAETHHGVYAMGDRAGTVGWMLRDPVVQMEGLVMDGGYLERVKREERLGEVLREYRVEFYIATNPRAMGGCYAVEEPAQAGMDSAKLRGRFCSEPLGRFEHGGVVTMIFRAADVRD